MPEHQVRVALAHPRQFADGEWQRLALLLDGAEQVRAIGFRHEADRRAFVIAHAMRRALLSGLLDVPVHVVRLGQAPSSRPVLDQPAGANAFFSLSRRRGLVACAAAVGVPLGIDVEEIDPARADFDLLRPFMHLPDGTPAPDEFFRLWTGLEAFWKLMGAGLDSRHPRIELAGEFVCETGGDGRRLARLSRLRPSAGFAVTLAVGGPAIHGDTTLLTHACNSAAEVLALSSRVAATGEPPRPTITA